MIRTAFEEKWYDYDGWNIRYIDEGEGDVILFLHGLGGRIEDNENCFRHFTDRYRVVAMDCPGTGFSDMPEIEYSIDFLVDFSLDFATRLGIGEFYVCGGSQGGMQALLCSRAAPGRIKKCAVYSPSGVWPANPFMAGFFGSLPPEAVRFFFRITSLFWNSPFYPGYFELRRKSLEFVNSCDLHGFGKHVFGCLESVFERDHRQLYKEVETPVLILWGKHDFGMPVKQGRELDAILPDSRLIEVPAAGHNVSTEKPEYFAETVMDFFAE